ncbi:MAG: putative DNA binding domain-containing protein [Planctomycetaceae bacterium]|nr:putative DNA binding domain-containing protein [Planctomycetaceae bacterium]
MTADQLCRLVAEGESDRLEFKKTTGDLKGGMETLCGFLNGEGGKVLFGVTSSGQARGQDVSDKTLQEVAQDLMRFEPPAPISQLRVPIAEGKEVIVLETIAGPEAPYTYRNRPYRRIGTTTSPMPQQEYARRLLERGHSQSRWENRVAEGYALRDLDLDEVRRMVSEAGDAGRLDAPVTGPREALQKLHLLDNGRPLQAAIVAFAKEVQPSYPQCGLRMARFRGTTKTEFLDQRQLTGNAFRLLDESLLFLRRHLPVRGRFEPGLMQRQDEPLFPPLALREALVNALCHRDYSIAGGAISIAIYDDRLEISSTGTLPFGVTVDDLKRAHESRPRNPLLAEVFHRRGLIERWGRGTQKIVELCIAAGHPEPEFEERGGDVVVRFIPSGYSPPHRVSHDLTERQRRILHVLSDGMKWRSHDVANQFPSPPPASSLRDDLMMLRSLGLVESGGRGPGARWWLKQPDSEPERAEESRK